MGKRFQNTQKSIYKRIKLGFGTGEFFSYKPWYRVQDISSYGRCHRIKNWHHGRVHHFLSDLEERIFYLYSWSDQLIDIREQYPLLPQEETIQIAKELRIKHPTDPKTRYPIVLTTDFFLKKACNIGNIYIARTAKYSSFINNYRTIEKLEIERIYWQRRNIDWKVVTNKNLPLQMAFNIKWVYPYFKAESLNPLTDEQIKVTATLLTKMVMEFKQPLRKITAYSDKYFDYPTGTSINVVRHLISRKFWKTDMNKRRIMSGFFQFLDSEKHTNQFIQL